MTSMPTIDDHMVALFRRAGRRRASYRSGRSSRLTAGGARVMPQADPGCSHEGQFCTWHGMPGKCDANLTCIVWPLPPGHL
jgi:hypothetical protein